jgi:outer membrane assembly lipoprotein YfiO
LVSFSLNAYSFWIWSPKTQKWKNPKYSPLATPYLQFKEAVKLFDKGSYSDAHREFKKLLVNYPDAKEAADAQYYLGRCLEKMDKPYDAFLEYHKVVDSYPNSQRISEIIEKEYNIGEYFLNREHKQWLGLSLYDFVEHPSIEIFRKIVDKAPYSEYAPRAQYKLGILFMHLARYEEARDSFQKLIDSYADSEWATPAKYQLAIATSKAFPGADYDSSYLKEATERLDEFIKNHPDAKISSEAEEQLKELRNREAKKDFDTAEFYEKQGQYKSAIIYYKKIIDNYEDSDYYGMSLERSKELNELIDGNITKHDFIKKENREKQQEKRAEILRQKEEKRNEKLELKARKTQEKYERQQRNKERKEQKKQEKLKRIEENRAKKQVQNKEALSENQQEPSK